MNSENENNEQPKMVKRGRPKIHDDKKKYHRDYYNNIYKDKIGGIYLCEICNVYCSVANKTRHNKSTGHTKSLLVKENLNVN